MSLMRPDWDPYDHIQYLDMMSIRQAEQIEDLTEKLVNTIWLLEEAAKQITSLTTGINNIHRRQLEQLRRIQQLESQQ